MPKFLWSGRTALGRDEVDEVDAETPEEARKVLEKRGWTELRQHTTDVSDFVARQIRESREPRDYEDTPLSPKEKLQYRQGTAPGLWSRWFEQLRSSSVLILMLVVCLALALLIGKLTVAKEIWIGCLLIVLAYVVFLYPVILWKLKRSKRGFVHLHTARTWHRWDEVLRCLDELAAAKRDTNITIGDYAMERYRSLALAGLGRLDEGLTIYRAAVEKARTPTWMAHHAEAMMYIVTRQYDRALECYRLSLETAVDKSTPCLDMGMFLVERFNRPDEAKKLLAQAEKAQLSELARIYVLKLRGAIAFREGDHQAVDKNMREALAEFEKRAAIKSKAYLYEGSILSCKGYLAMSSAALGNADEARRLFAKAGEYLKVTEFSDLVRAYEALSRNGKG